MSWWATSVMAGVMAGAGYVDASIFGFRYIDIRFSVYRYSVFSIYRYSAFDISIFGFRYIDIRFSMYRYSVFDISIFGFRCIDIRFSIYRYSVFDVSIFVMVTSRDLENCLQFFSDDRPTYYYRSLKA